MRGISSKKSDSPQRLDRYLYTIDTTAKEHALQVVNRSITKVVMDQKSLLDTSRPGWWVPGVGSVARALRLMRDQKHDTHFQKYIQKYMEYEPMADVALRRLQATQTQARPSSAASARCSFGSGRAEYSAKARRQQQAAAHGDGRDTHVNPAASNPPAYQQQRPFSAASDPLAIGRHKRSSWDILRRNVSQGRPSMQTRQMNGAAGSAIVSHAPLKVWMLPSWDNTAVAVASASPPPAAGAAAAAAREKQQKGGALEQPPVVDLRPGGVASAMISAAMQPKGPVLNNSLTGLTASDIASNADAASVAPAASMFVPQEYGTTFRAHQHLVYHLPQPELAVDRENQSVSMSRSRFSNISMVEAASVSGASADSSPQPAQQQEAQSPAETADQEEKRLLSNYGYRSSGMELQHKAPKQSSRKHAFSVIETKKSL